MNYVFLGFALFAIIGRIVWTYYFQKFGPRTPLRTVYRYALTRNGDSHDIWLVEFRTGVPNDNETFLKAIDREGFTWVESIDLKLLRGAQLPRGRTIYAVIANRFVILVDVISRSPQYNCLRWGRKISPKDFGKDHYAIFAVTPKDLVSSKRKRRVPRVFRPSLA